MGRVLLKCENSEVLNVVSGLRPTDPDSERLRCLIEEWLKRNEKATVSELVEACGHPDVSCQGVVKRKLKEKGLLKTSS